MKSTRGLGPVVSSALYRCAPAPVCVGTHIKVKTGRGWRTPEVPALWMWEQNRRIGSSRSFEVIQREARPFLKIIYLKKEINAERQAEGFNLVEEHCT